MTAKEMYEKIDNLDNINPQTNEPIGADLMDLYYEGREAEAIIYIQEFFECEINLAKEAFEIFKTEMGTPPSKQQIAQANAAAREWQNKPKCPICNSTNIKHITTATKVANIAMFGLLGNKRKYQWHCNNCKTDF